MSKIRAVRLNSDEEQSVVEFLKNNPFLDFSTVVRMALRQFLANPKLNLEKATNKSNKRQKENQI